MKISHLQEESSMAPNMNRKLVDSKFFTQKILF